MNKKVRQILKTSVIYFIIQFIILFNGCDSTEPDTGNGSFTATITNDTPGFSFSQGKAISLPNNDNITPDLFVLAHRAEDGTVLGVFFAADSLRPAFNLIKNFSDPDSAEIFFDDLSEAPDSGYQNLALPVNINQLWTVKTHDNKYAKILIIYTEAYEDTAALNYHLEATFRWKYQPDGTRFF